jgi:hypothetical protein
VDPIATLWDTPVLWDDLLLWDSEIDEPGPGPGPGPGGGGNPRQSIGDYDDAIEEGIILRDPRPRRDD